MIYEFELNEALHILVFIVLSLNLNVFNWLVKLVSILWFKERENSGNNGENSQQTNSTISAATNTTETSSSHTTTQDQLQSVAARSVLEMGYTKEQVLDALRKINELRPGMSIFMFSAYINVSISSRNI